jgi:hypothetical protein
MIRSCKAAGILLGALFFALAGCQTPGPTALHVSAASETLPPAFIVPIDVQRLAVLYPKTASLELVVAYARLEAAAFQLKEQRPSLRIIERFYIDTVLGEQRFQFGGTVSETSAIRLGRLLGVDSVLIYRIEVPPLRDRIWVRHPADLSPYTVTSKIIRVETGEVVLHNVVTSEVGEHDGWSLASSDSSDFQRMSRAALEHGVATTVANLRRAFQ